MTSKKYDDREIIDYLRNNKATYKDLSDKFGMHRTTAFRSLERISAAGYDVKCDKDGNTKVFYLGKEPKKAPGLEKAITSHDKRAATQHGRSVYNDLVEAFKEIYDEYDTFKQPEDMVFEDESAVLYVSDIHMGAVVEKDGEIIYDSEIAAEKVNQLERNTLKLMDYVENSKNVEDFYIAFLGDIIENDIIYENQKYEIDKTPLDQVRDAAKSFVPFIKACSDRYEQVGIYTTRGNHGRMGEGTHDASNWDNIFYNMLKLSLSEIDNVYVNIGEGEWNEFEIANKKIGITHGDNLHYQAGTSAGEKKFLRQIKMRDLDEVHLGHYHSRKSDEILGTEIYWNSSAKPSGDYEEKLGVDSDLCQTLMTYSPERGTTGIHFVDLRDDEKNTEEQL